MRAWAFINIEDPLIAWLAYRGEVFSSVPGFSGALSMFAAARLRASKRGPALFEAEVELERRRLQAHPDKASRMRGLYAFPSERDALRAAAVWGRSFKRENLTELAISDDSVVTSYASEWISHRMASGTGARMDAWCCTRRLLP